MLSVRSTIHFVLVSEPEEKSSLSKLVLWLARVSFSPARGALSLAPGVLSPTFGGASQPMAARAGVADARKSRAVIIVQEIGCFMVAPH
jgi:hypothetical protein